MSTKNKTKGTFAKLPRDYAGQVRLHVPRPVHDATDLGDITEIINCMALYETHFSSDQRDYFDLLCQIAAVYEEQHVAPPRRTVRQRLQYLLDEHGLTGADLSRILNATRNLGAMILKGDREITADHARTLGAHFGLPAGAFIE